MADEPKKRGRGRPKGTPASAAQKATVVGAQEASRKARAERKAAREAEAERLRALELPVKPRWRQLEDGDIRVSDLTLDELARLEISNSDGSWEGQRHPLSSRVISSMQTELAKRIKRGIHGIAPAALEALEEMVDDNENPAQRLKAVQMVLDHTVGKPADIVHIGVENEWDRMTQTAFVIQRGTDAVTDGVEPPATESDQQTVAGEVVSRA